MRVQGDVGMLQSYGSPTIGRSTGPPYQDDNSHHLPSNDLGNVYGTSSGKLAHSSNSNGGVATSSGVSFTDSPDTVTAKYTPGGYGYDSSKYRSSTPSYSATATATGPNKTKTYTQSSLASAGSSSSFNVTDKDILMQGVRNLGLGDSFGDLDALDVGLVGLDYDLDQGHESYYPHSNTATSGSKLRGGLPSRSGSTSYQPDVDLESLDYYATMSNHRQDPSNVAASAAATSAKGSTYSNPYLRMNTR